MDRRRRDNRFCEGATLQDWYAPNITADPHKGIGSWTIAGIVST
jgi:hypothetical protein